MSEHNTYSEEENLSFLDDEVAFRSFLKEKKLGFWDKEVTLENFLQWIKENESNND